MLKRPPRSESFSDKIHRYRGVLLVISLPLLLVVFVLFLMPSANEEYEISGRKITSSALLKNSRNYAVIFDAGSSGSRVHVYCFNRNMDLVPIGDDLELFLQLTPGLSAYANDPIAAANSIVSLLDRAQGVVPKELRHQTPVRVGATAGLRSIGNEKSEKILQAVRNLLQERSSLKSEPNGVTVLDGTQEGSYQWVTMNYLLGRLGKFYSDTVGVVDLGGGSVQMAYAVPESDAANAPKAIHGDEEYIKPMLLKGTKYYLYVHSYLRYGLLAARAEILKASEGETNPCLMRGYDGVYPYGGYEIKAVGSDSVDVDACRAVVLKALKKNETLCTHMKCTFGGIWNGGGGGGQKNLFVASFFYDRAAEVGFIDKAEPVVRVRPENFEDAAKKVCDADVDKLKAEYPNVAEANLPYICMDLVYQYSLLVDGFGLDKRQEISLVKKVKYQNHLVEAAWPLGSAIEAVSAAV